MALSTDILLGVPYNVGGTLREVDASTVVDNVFTFSSNGKKWQRVFDGGNSVYRASWLNITGAPVNKAALINIALANAAIQTLEIDTTIQIDSSVNFSGKTLSVKSGGLITGTYAISNAVIEGNLTQKILDPTGTLTASKSATGKWHPTWFGATGDGTTDDYAAVNFAVGVANTNEQKSVSLIQGNYLLNTNLSVPSGVTLEFNKGAYFSGSVTISGAGEFDAQNSLAFGGTIVVSGLYSISGQVTPQMWGAVGNNSTNDAPAINRMFAYSLTAPNNLINILFPAKRYYISESIYFPNVTTAGITIKIEGYGSTIRTDQDIPMFYRMPTTNGEANNLITTIFIIKGFRFTGNSSIAAPKTNQIGLLFGALYTSVFEDLQFESIYDGINLQFALGCILKNIRVTNQTNNAIVGRYGTWSGATSSNSSFNGNHIINCRVYNRDGANSALYLLGADQTLVNGFISEGFTAKYDIYYNYAGNNTVNTNTFSNIWFESVAGTAYPKNTNFYIRCPYITNIISPQRDYGNYLFELDMPTGGWSIYLSGLQYISGTPPLFKATGSTDGMIYITESRSSLDVIFRDPSYWEGGSTRNFLFSGRTSTTFDPDSINGYKDYNSLAVLIEGESYTNIRSRSTNAVVPVLLLNNHPSITTPRSLLMGYLYNSSTHNTLTAGLFTLFTNSPSSDPKAKGYVITNIGDNGGNSPAFTFSRAMGTPDAPTSVINGTILGGIYMQGYITNALQTGAQITSSVDGTPSTTPPSDWKFYNRNTSGTIVNTFRIRASGAIEILVAPATGSMSDGIMTITSGGAVRQIAISSIIGTGVINTLGYFDANGGAVKSLTAITASRALKSDANGLPIAFDTATEPSLTELTYVKGVTSPIQGQLGTKGLYAADGDGVLVTFTVTHGFSTTPTNIQVTPAGVDSAVPFFVNNITATTFDVTFTTPPIVGTNNVTFYWTAK